MVLEVKILSSFIVSSYHITSHHHIISFHFISISYIIYHIINISLNKYCCPDLFGRFFCISFHENLSDSKSKILQLYRHIGFHKKKCWTVNVSISNICILPFPNCKFILKMLLKEATNVDLDIDAGERCYFQLSSIITICTWIFFQ